MGGRCRGDKQISQARSAGPPRCPRGREHAAVCARRLGVERQGLPRGHRPLETVLTPCPFPAVAGGVRTGGELGKRHCSNGGFVNGGFVRERPRIDDVVVDTTEVSSSPLVDSAIDGLIRNGIQIGTHTVGIDPRGAPRRLRNHRSKHEPPL